MKCDRVLGAKPQSRNESLASFLRRANICEERGSGIEKTISAIEVFQLPAPDFSVQGDHTLVKLFSPKELRQMTRRDKIRACYQHAGLRWLSSEQMTNTSLRTRFGISKSSSAQASRIIKETLKAGMIKEYDPSSSLKFKSYIPYWA